jgi:hypothetical protein
MGEADRQIEKAWSCLGPIEHEAAGTAGLRLLADLIIRRDH